MNKIDVSAIIFRIQEEYGTNKHKYWFEAADKVLLELPDLPKPLTWIDPKVSQPKELSWFVTRCEAGDCHLHHKTFTIEKVTRPWHYVTIAPIPEPESELVKYLRSVWGYERAGLEDHIAKVKEFEAKKK